MAVSLEEQIKDQVEFYLGDSNFARDKFFKSEAAKNEEGWIDMRVLLRCNRLKELTEDGAKVAESLQNSDIVEVSEDSKAVRRKNPLPGDALQQFRARTVHAKTFSSQASFEQIGEFFAQFGKVTSVRVRRVQDKSIGEAFVEFDTVEAAQKAVEAAADDQLSVEGAPLADQGKKETLCVTMFADWHGSASKRPRMDIDDESGSSSSSSSSSSSAEASDKDVQVEYTSGTVLSLKFADEPAPEPALHFSHVKDLLKEFDVKFVELNVDNKIAYARFDTPTAAEVAATLTERQTTVCGVPTVFSSLEGDDEREFYVRAEIQRQKKQNQPRQNKRRRRR